MTTHPRKKTMKRPKGKAGPWQAEADSWPEEHREWAVEAAVTMIFSGADEAVVAPALAEIRESVAASGQSPTELFGDSFEYGLAAGKRLRPPVEVLENRLPFRNVVGGISVMLFAFGGMLTVLGPWFGFDDGWTEVSFSGPVVWFLPLVCVFVGLGLWGWVLRTRGRLKAAWLSWAGTVAGLAGIVTLAANLDDVPMQGPLNWIFR
ncbi:hypothetical protein [Paeniglutamicibacter kerguelensis]|uniref:DUF1707 domain-containing protein n=1 Tax=Paeniglutamicibacter kerguelensis TaxID=254788 RepID=A0ABS4XCA9_9MICC|nr:hypothetical protein [Paeniglutamicibacter kerguelensis]MBP2386113.1 hypothetical protein [Paeniglutamicibacter kerguelensis]